LSVPFERFVELKSLIEGRRRWRRITADLAYFELEWKPQSWARPARFVCAQPRGPAPGRAVAAQPLRAPRTRLRVQGHRDQQTNKAVGAATVLAFHNGRGPWKFSLSMRHFFSGILG
jgi:hypothetical protein